VDLSIESIAVLGIAGILGTGLFVYGRRQQRLTHMIAGVALILYGLVVPGWTLQAAVGVAILGALFLATRLGL
jgi:hypothetical protein